MKIPAKGETVTYFVSNTKVAAVNYDGDKFWVTIVDNRNIKLPTESPFDDKSNVRFLDTFEQVKEFLLQRADPDYKTQFDE